MLYAQKKNKYIQTSKNCENSLIYKLKYFRKPITILSAFLSRPTYTFYSSRSKEFANENKSNTVNN